MADCPLRRLEPTRGSVFVDLGAWHFVVFSDGRASSRVTKVTFCGTSSLTASTETGRAAVDSLAASWAGYLGASSEGCSSVESDWDCWGDLTMTLVPWLYEACSSPTAEHAGFCYPK